MSDLDPPLNMSEDNVWFFIADGLSPRHALPENYDDAPIGTVYFSDGTNTWWRKAGRARWHTELVAKDEDVYHMHGRRYP